MKPKGKRNRLKKLKRLKNEKLEQKNNPEAEIKQAEINASKSVNRHRNADGEVI